MLIYLTNKRIFSKILKELDVKSSEIDTTWVDNLTLSLLT